MAAHHHPDVDPGQAAVVQVGADEGQGHETGGGTEARAVVGLPQVVVDGLGDVEGVELVLRILGVLVDDVRRLRAVIAADVEEVAHPVLAEVVEDHPALIRSGLLAHAAQGAGGGVAHRLQVVQGFGAQVDEVLLQNPIDTVERAIEIGNQVRVLAGFQHRADQALIDDIGGPTRLPDHRSATVCGSHLDSSLEIKNAHWRRRSLKLTASVTAVNEHGAPISAAGAALRPG